VGKTKDGIRVKNQQNLGLNRGQGQKKGLYKKRKAKKHKEGIGPSRNQKHAMGGNPDMSGESEKS